MHKQNETLAGFQWSQSWPNCRFYISIQQTFTYWKSWLSKWGKKNAVSQDDDRFYEDIYFGGKIYVV